MRIGPRAVVTIALLPLLTLAAPANGSFELGTLGGWSAFGQATIENAVFGISPPQGSFQALLLSSDEGSAGDAALLADFLGVSAVSLEGYFGGSAVKQTLNAAAGQGLLFSWNFLNGEFTNSDLVFLSVNGEVIALASSATQGGARGVMTTAGMFASNGYLPGMFVIPATGAYTIGFGVVNGGDDSVQSGLLLDNVRLVDAAPVPEPSTAATYIVGAAAFALVAFARKRV